MKTDLPTLAARIEIGSIPLWVLKSDHDLARFSAGKGVLPSLAPLDAVFDHHWRHALDFTYLDIGAKYGLSTILAAEFMNARGHANRVIGFEPGAGAALIDRNLAMNGLDGRVTLEHVAVSDRCGEAILYGEPEHPEDNHLIRRNTARPYGEKRVPTVSLDAYAGIHGIRAPLIVKVDTQGAEWEVWRGMRRTVKSGLVTILIEFTPWTFEGRAHPVDFLERMADGHALININPKNLTGDFSDEGLPYHLISRAAMADFTRRVEESAPGWTDILCIPHMMPDGDGLIGTILGSRNGG